MSSLLFSKTELKHFSYGFRILVRYVSLSILRQAYFFPSHCLLIYLLATYDVRYVHSRQNRSTARAISGTNFYEARQATFHMHEQQALSLWYITSFTENPRKVRWWTNKLYFNRMVMWGMRYEAVDDTIKILQKSRISTIVLEHLKLLIVNP